MLSVPERSVFSEHYRNRNVGKGVFAHVVSVLLDDTRTTRAVVVVAVFKPAPSYFWRDILYCMPNVLVYPFFHCCHGCFSFRLCCCHLWPHPDRNALQT